MKTMRRFFFKTLHRAVLLLLLALFCQSAEAQHCSRAKLSPWLRQLVDVQKNEARRAAKSIPAQGGPAVCAFVRIADDHAQQVFDAYHAQALSQTGNIFIANIPLSELSAMAADPRVSRIEASPLGKVLLDSMSTHLNALPVYAGQGLPQAYTGKDVVVGVMDIGFDLTHPNFYSRDLKDYRIKALWDMLSADTLGSRLPVGRDYMGTQALLEAQHSRDGNDFTHGTHTLGIAAGSGYDSPYRGMAPESDICLVANAVSNNKQYIDSTQQYKFTDAMNALGFKYIFDYAESVGKPCVASLSEGGHENFWGDSQLYYEMLEQLVGPGRIIVAAAGNQGHQKTWMHKERGVAQKGTFVYVGQNMVFTLKSKDDFAFRFVYYNETKNDTVLISSREVLQSPDSIYRCMAPQIDSLAVGAYPSCYDPTDICYEVVLYNNHSIGLHYPLSLELLGQEADVELWPLNVFLSDNEANPLLNGAEVSHNIHAPSAAPCVISVGATTYRNGTINAQGDSCVFVDGEYGRKANMSSSGPTMDGRTKPDVMAPGINIVSSYSSYYIAAHPEAEDARWNVGYYDFGGRTYAWNCNSGTSSSAPAVAGAIALWLQAKPDLTPDEAKAVMARTSRHCDPTLAYPNNLYGHGELDAYHGLLYLLGVDHIDEISKQASPVKMGFTEGGQLRLLFPEALSTQMRATVYQLSGSKLAQQAVSAGTTDCRIDLPQAQRGEVYVVQLDGYRPFAGSMLVRR